MGKENLFEAFGDAGSIISILLGRWPRDLRKPKFRLVGAGEFRARGSTAQRVPGEWFLIDKEFFWVRFTSLGA